MLFSTLCGLSLAVAFISAAPYGYDEDQYIQQLVREQQMQYGDLDQQYQHNSYNPRGHGHHAQDFGRHQSHGQYADYDRSQDHRGRHVAQDFDQHNFQQQYRDQSGQLGDFDQSQDDHLGQVVQDFGKEDFSQQSQDQRGQYFDDRHNGGKTEVFNQQQSQDWDWDEKQEENGAIQQQTQDLGQEFEDLDKVEGGKPEKVIESLDQHGIQQETQDLSQQFINAEQSESQLGKIEDLNGIEQETQDMGQEFVDMNLDEGKGEEIQQQTQDLTQQFVDFDQSEDQLGKIENVNGIEQETQDMGQEFVDMNLDEGKGEEIQQQKQYLTQQSVDFDQSQDQLGKIEDMNQNGIQQEKQDVPAGREFHESDLIIEPYVESEPMVQQVEDWNQHNNGEEQTGKANNIEQVNQQEDFWDMDQLGVGQKEDYWSQQNTEKQKTEDMSEQMITDQQANEQQISQSTFQGTDKEIEQLFGNDNTQQEYENSGIYDFKPDKQLEQTLDDELLSQLQNQQELGNDEYQQTQNKEDFSPEKLVVPELSENKVTQFVEPLDHERDNKYGNRGPHGRHNNMVDSGSFEGSHSIEVPSELPGDYHTQPPSFWRRHWGKAKSKAKAIVNKIHETIG